MFLHFARSPDGLCWAYERSAVCSREHISSSLSRSRSTKPSKLQTKSANFLIYLYDCEIVLGQTGFSVLQFVLLIFSIGLSDVHTSDILFIPTPPSFLHSILDDVGSLCKWHGKLVMLKIRRTKYEEMASYSDPKTCPRLHRATCLFAWRGCPSHF
ncbi:hypothetical protein K402DRAFT_111586 [Aulographum hederae CBS 113979]|uniref:Uncharacterized protein n=1 Tax=Aulographum hederae CBS 113979 TaxID=1176131 RepID=A0A6G1GW45_9PEZI|nr:hypothetical protein K402DRAFT_111586 [Aulographum hederae CBS 113979]